MKLSFLLLISVLLSCGEQKLISEEILERSIGFHDPENQWQSLETILNFKEEGANGPRQTTVWIDNNTGYFRVRRGSVEDHGMVQDSCFINSGNVDCNRAERLRNYYLYLWGLPMKLRDSGTVLIDRVDSIRWNGYDVLTLQVEYEEDRWTYYIDQTDYQLRGYSFLKNDGSGEWIELEGIEKVQGMRLPKSRAWYVFSDSAYLGRDLLLSGE
ncbi:DUF6503 family protein [Fulvivirga sedimenti]|uniref:DUF6503 family protein n=1 Tax=Fulvivirga sedimenti TaxID=2879465 RepID=A0A9X1KWY3_9BACT|nr:DUF6503 family protein [Fulvivirga sedimenti]MCA6075236.1 DUF6503 family protein [Fulvivirga sedimenti]MCA6076413.1 DUF6503 family protein [Fulvivirga sedimenti]MCA6077541.1 DUF6503 family protein [Fulvivirga sedimenti]